MQKMCKKSLGLGLLCEAYANYKIFLGLMDSELLYLWTELAWRVQISVTLYLLCDINKFTQRGQIDVERNVCWALNRGGGGKFLVQRSIRGHAAEMGSKISLQV